MKTPFWLGLLLTADFFILLAELSGLSISYFEARTVFEETSLLHGIVQASIALFGQNDFALRFPMIAMHLLSTLLLFTISAPYLKYDRDRLWLVLIYVLLPGVNSAALVVDEAGLILLLLFIYLYVRQRWPKAEYVVLAPLFAVHYVFAVLYLALMMFALQNGRRTMALYSGVWLLLTLWYQHYGIAGVPKGHFLDSLGVYAAIFSPIVFVYIVYVLYRRAVLDRRDILWYLASTALVYSLLFSFRQRMELHAFAPFILVALPIVAQSFFRSYRVRLREFRTRYRVVFSISFTLLVLNAVAVLFNKQLYGFTGNPKEHFAYKMHVVKELSEALKGRQIACVDAQSPKLQLRLKYYGITHCPMRRLSPCANAEDANCVTISYNGVSVSSYSVTEIPKK